MGKNMKMLQNNHGSHVKAFLKQYSPIGLLLSLLNLLLLLLL